MRQKYVCKEPTVSGVYCKKTRDLIEELERDGDTVPEHIADFIEDRHQKGLITGHKFIGTEEWA